jgi:CheY-like chemotaxis protein
VSRRTAFIIRDESIQSILHDQALLLDMLIYQLGQELVGAAPCGKDALKQIKALRPDIIWLDTPLKDSPDGLSIARKIRKIYNPVIIGLTASVQNSAIPHPNTGQRKLTELTHCFTKPLSFSKVKASVQGAV